MLSPSEQDLINLAAVRLRQSGKTTLAKGLENYIRDHGSPAPLDEAARAEAIVAGVVSEDKTDSAIPSDDLSEVPDYVSSKGEFEALKTILEKTTLNALLTGPTGSGKTNLVQAVAKHLGREMFTIQGGGGATYERVVRKDLLAFDRGVTVSGWRDGVLPVSMKRGSILYLDEPNAMPNEVLFYLFGAMDHRRAISFDDGSSVKAAKGFTVIAAMNEGSGYAGTNLLNNAFRSRGDAIFSLDYLSPAAEAKLLKERTGVPIDMARALIKIATDLRKALERKDIRTPIGTRDLLATAVLIQSGLDRALAVELGIVNKVPSQFPAERKSFTDVVAAHLIREES